jgi:hypothetical protein
MNALSVEDILNWDVDNIMDFVCNLGSHHPGDQFNWSLFASAATTEFGLLKDENRELACKWARIGIKLYDNLAIAVEPLSLSQRDFHELVSMGLRAWLIQKLGPAPASEVQDPRVLENWFVRRLPFDTVTARSILEGTKRLTVDEEIAWLGIKERLEVLRPLSRLGLLSDDSEVMKWLHLFSHNERLT